MKTPQSEIFTSTVQPQELNQKHKNGTSAKPHRTQTRPPSPKQPPISNLPQQLLVSLASPLHVSSPWRIPLSHLTNRFIKQLKTLTTTTTHYYYYLTILLLRLILSGTTDTKTMKLYVCLLEGRDLPVKDSYAKLKVGKHKSSTRVLNNTQNPLWNEEFLFRVSDLDDELLVSVYKHADHGHEPHGLLFFGAAAAGEVVGRVRIPLRSVAAEENWNLRPTWFSLERPKNLKSQDKETCGTLLLSISLHGEGQDSGGQHLIFHTNSANSFKEEETNSGLSTPSFKKGHDAKHMVKALTSRLDKLFHKKHETNHNDHNSSEVSTPSEYDDSLEEPPSSSGSSFQELIELMQTKSENVEMPENLHGGILLDQTYVTSPEDLNMFLFSPDSNFMKDLAEIQGTIDVREEPWKLKSEGVPSLTRVVTYIKAASKLVKAVKATETQTYTKAAGREFAVFVSVNTPDVPYGSTFHVELLYKILPGKESSSGEESAHLVISWAVNFCQSTMMKGMIENGAKQGLKESFEQFASLLSQKFRVVTVSDTSGKDHMLATLETEQRSDWELAVHYFWNFTVVSTIFMCLYFLVHIFLCEPNKFQGLEFGGLDLPDSFGEIITCGILVIQLERVYNMLSHFVEARLRRGSDHGIKAQGDGWVLTVGLIEGVNLASMNSTEIPDPYVVFTCNGKTRTSSVKLQTLDPQWNEILEFDAAEEPPAVLDVEVFDFDGPFDQASSGHCEINFLKHTAEELADLWVNLNGKLAQSSQSKLHLRIFLDNNNGVETIRDYLSNLEREVGKKLNLRSPHRNTVFQKVFGLPPEEFLISDFACSLRRRLPLQGRLFLSARIIGFYSNLFGRKTKFYFLWEDIEDIQVLPPSLAAVGSPSIEIILHNGRGLDARHGAKLLDEEGRLHFVFHSFVSFSDASRTMMGLWKTRTLEADQKTQIVEEKLQDDEKTCLPEDTGSHLVVEDVDMTKVYSVELPMNLKSLMKMFDGGELEQRVMSKSGCLNYVTTAWEEVKPGLQERRISYKFSRRISIFGGEVTCTQQKSAMPDGGGWVVSEIMTLHDVPLSDQFRVQFRYQIENSSFTHNSCKCSIYIGVVWLKNSQFEPRITKNIVEKFTLRVEEILQLVEKEILLTGNPDSAGTHGVFDS